MAVCVRGRLFVLFFCSEVLTPLHGRLLLVFLLRILLSLCFFSYRLLTGWCKRKLKTSPAIARSAVSKIATVVGGKFDDDESDGDDEEVAPADERIRSTDDVKSDAANSTYFSSSIAAN